eukprot:31367_1
MSKFKKDKHNNILKKGPLQKKSTGFFGAWQTRYFVLTKDGNFAYYTDKKFRNGKRDIDLSTVTNIVRKDDTNLVLHTPKRIWYLYNDIKNEIDHWQKCISNIVSTSNSIHTTVLQLCTIEHILFLLNGLNDDDIKPYKQNIASYIAENNINGEKLLEMGRVSFGKNVMQFADNTNVNLNGVIRVYDKLKKFDITTNYNRAKKAYSNPYFDADLLASLNKIIYVADEKNNLPLHRFTVKDVCNKLKLWVCNDINYKTTLTKMQQLFDQYSLSGQNIERLPSYIVECIIKEEMLQFITLDTLYIIFDYLQIWKKSDSENIRSKTPDEMATILHNYPLMHLLHAVKSRKIDGKQIINVLQEEKNNVIQEKSGWDYKEILQIKMILSKYQTFTKDQFVENMKNVFNQNQMIFKTTLNQFKQIILDPQFDVAKLHFKVKNIHNIDDFSDTMINMVDEIIENINKHDKQIDFVSQIYTSIAQCFVGNDEAQNWFCYNCSNFNFPKYIDNKLSNPFICRLCGLSQDEGISLKLRRYDTFAMVNNIDENTEEEHVTNKHNDDIDLLIQETIQSADIDVRCSNQNNNKQCTSMLRLSKHLIAYKRWLKVVSAKTNGKDNIEKTVSINIACIDNDEFKQTFIENIVSCKHKKITENHKQLLLQMIEKNLNNIADIKTFAKTNRKQFINMIKKHTQIKPAFLRRIYDALKAALNVMAQEKHFSKFLSESQMNMVDKDYHHILKYHIHNANQSCVKNTFRFFNKVVHYDDKPSDVEVCRSVKRRAGRIYNMQSKDNEPNSKSNNSKSNNKPDSKHRLGNKDIWKLKNYYNQKQLDTIHHYLVHTDWKEYTQRKFKKNNKASDEKEMLDDESISYQEIERPRDKFASEFGFGIKYQHHTLKPIYTSVYDEVIYNKQYPLREEDFRNSLVKAIRQHKVAIHEHKHVLFCKYYDKKYNIVRNEPIGIGHILAIVIYTDLSAFCTKFRGTYRKQKK